MPAARKAKKGARRINWVATNRRIRRFLADELSELEVKRGARHLMTSPREIARCTGLDAKVVKKGLSEIAGRRVDGKVVVIRVGRTDVVVRLAGRAQRLLKNP